MLRLNIRWVAAYKLGTDRNFPRNSLVNIGVRVKLIDYSGPHLLFDCPSLVVRLAVTRILVKSSLSVVNRLLPTEKWGID